MKVQSPRGFFAKMIFALLLIFSFACKDNSEKEEATQIEVEQKEEINPFFKLSLAQWSLHREIMEDKSMSPFDFAERANQYGFSGVEYVNQLYAPQIKEMGLPAVLDTILAKSKEFGMTNVLIMVDGEGDLADPSVKVRDEAVENHKKWVDAAQFLGCHSIRVNTFGTNDPKVWHDAVVDGLTKLSEYAATKNINVLVENHGWLSSDVPKLMAAINEVNMPNCGTLPDFGNFCIKRKEGARWGDCEEEYPDIYDGVKQMMTKAKAVSAKSYDFGEDGHETKLDYPRLLKIVQNAGYTNFIGVEYEGDRLSEEEGILATKELLLKSVAEIENN